MNHSRNLSGAHTKDIMARTEVLQKEGMHFHSSISRKRVSLSSNRSRRMNASFSDLLPYARVQSPPEHQQKQAKILALPLVGGCLGRTGLSTLASIWESGLAFGAEIVKKSIRGMDTCEEGLYSTCFYSASAEDASCKT